MVDFQTTVLILFIISLLIIFFFMTLIYRYIHDYSINKRLTGKKSFPVISVHSFIIACLFLFLGITIVTIYKPHFISNLFNKQENLTFNTSNKVEEFNMNDIYLNLKDYVKSDDGLFYTSSYSTLYMSVEDNIIKELYFSVNTYYKNEGIIYSCKLNNSTNMTCSEVGSFNYSINENEFIQTKDWINIYDKFYQEYFITYANSNISNSTYELIINYNTFSDYYWGKEHNYTYIYDIDYNPTDYMWIEVIGDNVYENIFVPIQ